MSGTHAPLAPSSAEQWVKCWGAPKMQARYPERPDSAAAMGGEAAHWIVSELMCGRTYPVGSLAPNGVCITSEMHDGAEMFVETVPAVLFETGEGFHVEEMVLCLSINAQCWGTPDLWYVWQGVLHVVDYKYGYGHVDEWKNWQLICYYAGIIDTHPELATLDVELTIVQPRCYQGDGPVRTWRTTPAELKPFIDQLGVAATAAMDESRNRICSAHTHCRYCSAITHCSVAVQSVSYAIRVSRECEPVNMMPEALGLLRTMVADAQDMLKAMAGGMDEELEAAIRSGKNVPGWTLAAGRGKKEWQGSVSDVLAMGEMLGVDLSKAGVITPTQAAKKFKDAGLDESLIDADTLPGALKLAKSDVSSISRIFK